VWIGASGGDWSVAGNWVVYNTSTHRTPASGDTLYFGGLGGANTSSVDDLNATVSEIDESNTFTGTITLDASVTLTVSGQFTVYGTVDMAADAVISAGTLEVNSGTLNIDAVAAPNSNEPLSLSLLDMVSSATVHIVGSSAKTTLAITSVEMGDGTAVNIDSSTVVALDGAVTTCTGTIHLGDSTGGATLNVTGNYDQTSGNLILEDGSTLSIGGSTAYLSGHTTATGDVEIEASSVEVNGTGLFEYTSTASSTTLTFTGALDLAGGTFKFDDISGAVDVGGNLTILLATVDMNVTDGMSGAASNLFTVTGSVQLGPHSGSGGPTLNLTQIGTIPSPTTFTLITSSGTGSGGFNSITAGNTVLASGWTTVGSTDVYTVTL
jgi:hypothetical protein